MINLGVEHHLGYDEEMGISIDTKCYCQVCQYKQENLERVVNNFYYGFLIMPLWLYNFYIYLYACVRLNSSYQASESIIRKHKYEVTLNLEDEEGIVASLIRDHKSTGVEFDKWIGWSAMAFAVEIILLGLLVMIMTSITHTVSL